MSDPSDGFRELRKFCREVSLLLRSAQDMMKDKDWEKEKPLTVCYVYRAIDEPDWWLPHEFCRFFKNSDYPHLSPYIAVNLYAPQDASPVDYALLSAGCVVFQAGTKKRAKVEHWWSRWHLYMDDRKDDGTLCVDEPQTAWKPEEGAKKPLAGVSHVTTFAYPLVEITDPEALRDKIIKPLLRIIEDEGKKL